jgi:2-polyprenyl-3-methyl-5-hydroxy-6-metoxy-1,4-benzoquinol methylase
MAGVKDVSTIDKAGIAYWDHLYPSERRLRAIDPRDTSLRNHIACQFHNYFKNTFLAMGGKELLEVGCGGSQYLPYFAKEFGLRVTGIDYSQPGCTAATKLLAAEGMPGNVVCGDFFDPPPDLVGKFDVVVSMGVVEHFVDTPKCIGAIAKLVKPEGLVLTFVPNMRGLVGRLQKVFDRELFDKHVPLNKELLRRAHEKAGLTVEECSYFIFNSFFAFGLHPVGPDSVGRRVKAFVIRCLHYVSAVIWAFEKAFFRFPPLEFTSPYIVCAARAKR